MSETVVVMAATVWSACDTCLCGDSEKILSLFSLFLQVGPYSSLGHAHAVNIGSVDMSNAEIHATVEDSKGFFIICGPIEVAK